MNEILKAFISSNVRHAMTTIGGVLVTNGIIDKTDAMSFEKIGSGLIIGGIGFAWSWYKNHKQAKANINANADHH